MSTFFKRSVAYLSLAWLFSGCAEFTATTENTPISQPEPFSPVSVDKLLDFGARMSIMPDPEKIELCHSLLTAHQLLSSDDVQLQLMVGRLLCDACGDIPKILAGVKAISPNYPLDEKLQKFISIHTLTLQRIHNQSIKPVAIKQKTKKSKLLTEPKENTEKPTENHLLREKLEALRSMEKQMDENLEGH